MRVGESTAFVLLRSSSFLNLSRNVTPHMDFAMARSVMVILLIIFYIKGCVCEPYFIIKRMHQSNCLRKTYQKKKKSKAFDTSTYLSLPGHLTLAVVGDIGEDNKV